MEPLTTLEKFQNIMLMQSPNMKIVLEVFEFIKSMYGWTNHDIAMFFGLKNAGTLENSSAYNRYMIAVCRLFIAIEYDEDVRYSREIILPTIAVSNRTNTPPEPFIDFFEHLKEDGDAASDEQA